MGTIKFEGALTPNVPRGYGPAWNSALNALYLGERKQSWCPPNHSCPYWVVFHLCATRVSRINPLGFFPSWLGKQSGSFPRVNWVLKCEINCYTSRKSFRYFFILGPNKRLLATLSRLLIAFWFRFHEFQRDTTKVQVTALHKGGKQKISQQIF